MAIPITVAHFGTKPWYLRLCLESAARFNPEVVLIGDESNAEVWSKHWNYSQADMGKYREFMKSYVKMSDYSLAYETGFWRRPFVTEEWMKREGVKELFMIDSDLMSFADFSNEVVPLLPRGCRATLMTMPKQGTFDWWSSLHFSYWTLEALEDFTGFCIAAYRDKSIRAKLDAKYQWHLDNRRTGGICEMTMLYLWSNKNSSAVANLAEAVNNCVADLAIATSANCFDNEYAMRGGLKRFVFRNGVPYGFNKILNREIRFWCVHCQGEYKGVMRLLHNVRWRAFYAQIYAFGRFRERMERETRSLAKRTLKRLHPAG